MQLVIVKLDGSINELKAYNYDSVIVTGTAQIANFIIHQNGSKRTFSLLFDGSIKQLDVQDSEAKVRLKTGLNVRNVNLPSMIRIENIIEDYANIKQYIEQINGSANPDYTQVITAPKPD